MNTKLTDITFTRESVEAAIKSLKANSAPGPDGMTSELLSKCASVISEPLASLFSKSMQEASVPSLLKRAAVVPIYKGGDRSDPSNYRPVSLTPILTLVVRLPGVPGSKKKKKFFLKCVMERILICWY